MTKKVSKEEELLSLRRGVIEVKQTLDGFIRILDGLIDENALNSKLPLSQIFYVVCDEHGVDVVRALSKSRKREYAQCRNIYCKISVCEYGYDISVAVGYIRRDRSTFYNASKNHEGFMEYDSSYREKYDSILAKLEKIKNEKSKKES